jgi:hypothetical protein
MRKATADQNTAEMTSITARPRQTSPLFATDALLHFRVAFVSVAVRK